MARNRSFEVGGLNIRVHTEHSAREYTDFWLSLYRMQATASYGSDRLMIGEAMSTKKGDPKAPITGYFYKFLNINPDDPWFDINSKKPATDEDVSKLSIPENLKPNLKFIPYVFLPTTHKLYFISKASSSDAMAPRTVERLLSKIVVQGEIPDRFGKPDITVLTNQREIEDFWKWQVIKSLELFIERPNALEHEDEEEVLERLDELGARSVRTEWKKAPDAKTLLPNQRVKKLASIAADNGEVKIVGRNANGIRDSASSKNFPMHEPHSYNPNNQSPAQALLAFVINQFI